MKSIRKIIRKLVEINFTWAILHFFYKLFYRFKFEKDLIPLEATYKELAEKEAVLKKKFSDLTIRDGLFKGMKYPDFIAYGSALYPKLLGYYESELMPHLEKLLKNKYHAIVDVGCAEGYYAVGVAMRKPDATIYAYDIDTKAMDFCRRMAELNNATANMRFGTFCSAETLLNLDTGSRSLIFSDCEGYEKELFTPEVAKKLKNCDLVIELHDLYTETISPSVMDALKDTHNIEQVYSRNTFLKMREQGHAKDFTEEQILKFFVERNGIMMWIIATPKTAATV